jgi:capsular exopolysaccharide synthesis family protein
MVLNPETDPRVANTRRDIETLETRIAGLSNPESSGATGGLIYAIIFQEHINLWSVDQEIRLQQHLVRELSARFDAQLEDSADRSEKAARIAFLRTELHRTDTLLDRIEGRILSIQAEARAPQHITLISRATSSTPNRMRQMTTVGLGAVMFAFLPLFLSIAVERMKPRLYHVSQVRRAIPQVLIGEIMEPPISWIQGTAFRKRLARYRESVHNWCTHLLLSDPFRSCKTLSIASVAGDDGKTFLALQIAVAMAQMKPGKVLIIDGDMRVGRLHLLFGNEETGLGLADVLSFRNLPWEVIGQNEKEQNLELLTAGQLDGSPYELLGDGRFRELLDALEWSPSNPNGYALVIVVLPPIANAAESLIMAASTDSTLLCVRQKETVLGAMEDVYRKLVNTGASVDGIVVKDIPYYQMAGRDGGFADKLEQIRLSHLLKYAD